MKQESLEFAGLPALLWGERAERAYLYVHGQGGSKEEAAAFAAAACRRGWQVLSVDLPGHGVRTKEGGAFDPWHVVPELEWVLECARARWAAVSLYAVSIGAWFSMLAFAGQPLEDIILSADGPVYNNAAQAWNHAFFFGQLSPKPQKEPSGELLEAINRNFGSLDELKVQIGRAAAGLFGSGWVWLAEDPSGRLAVVSEQNAGNPMRHGMKPLLAIDVWEHAYYIDYRNRRAGAVEALWGVVDWKVVGDRYAEK